MPKAISSSVLQQCAKSLRVLAHPTRLRIVELLESKRLAVGELVEALDLPQAVVSQHLARMRAVGLLTVESEGQCRYYRISNPACPALLSCIRTHFA